MAGTALTNTSFTPVHTGTEADHAGQIRVSVLNLFGLYGITNRLNLTVSLPYKSWQQFAVEHQDTHHRNEAKTGFGDISLGLRGIVKNEFFGPGQRIFVDGILILPSGPDYAINPFGPEADDIDHTHFALGTGQVSLVGGVEWWQRSEFPIVMGVSSRYKQALSESKVGFLPGSVWRLTFHGIRQTPVLPSLFPYLKMEFRREWPDKWSGASAPNSGALFFDITGLLIYERSENTSLVFSIGYPAWQKLEGSQLAGVTYALSYRFTSL